MSELFMRLWGIVLLVGVVASSSRSHAGSVTYTIESLCECYQYDLSADGNEYALVLQVRDGQGVPQPGVEVFVEDPLRLVSAIVGSTNDSGIISYPIDLSSVEYPGDYLLLFYAATADNVLPIRVSVIAPTDPQSTLYTVNAGGSFGSLGPIDASPSELLALSAVLHAVHG
ncbi:MAG: hypothetical protein KDA22_08715, partial [Phycisphaerales bacterium]|nr:hypothetical protein [Phycisphaerales bacterium]